MENLDEKCYYLLRGGNNMTIYEIAWYFFIYAFLGWCTEVSFFAVKKGKFVNRGFLNGPVCPVYGFGLVAVIAALTPLKDNLLLLFLGSVLITSALEFLTGWALEKIFHTRWWDYTENKFNLCGYICLEFSLIWGLAATAVMKIIQPLIQTAVGIIPQAAGWVLLGVFAAVILCDLAATVTTIHNMQKNLRALTAMAAEMHEISDKIGENISEKVLDIKGQADDTKERYSGFAEMCRAHRAEEQSLSEKHRAEEQALLASIREKEKERIAKERSEKFEEQSAHLGRLRTELSEKLSAAKRRYSRIIKAFPDIKSRDYQEALDNLKKGETK